MRIIFVARHFHPHIGGVEKHLEKLCDGLLNEGHEITVICEQTPHTQEKSKKGKVEILRIDYPKTKLLGLFSIWRWMVKNRKLFSEADLVHIHDVVIWYFPLRVLLPKIPVYATFHGWEGVYPIPLKNKVLKKLSAKIVKANICVGRYIEKYYGIKANKIIYGAVDSQENIGFSKQNGKRILYLGRLEPDTGLLTYISAFHLLAQKYKDMRFEFLGDGPLRGECEKCGIVYGFRENIYEYAQDARFICTSGYLSILESLSLKRMVFSVSENDLKFDYLKLSPFEHLTIHCTNPYTLARKIEYFLKDPILERKVVTQGYDWAKEQTWDKIIKEYLSLWETK